MCEVWREEHSSPTEALNDTKPGCLHRHETYTAYTYKLFYLNNGVSRDTLGHTVHPPLSALSFYTRRLFTFFLYKT